MTTKTSKKASRLPSVQRSINHRSSKRSVAIVGLVVFMVWSRWRRDRTALPAVVPQERLRTLPSTSASSSPSLSSPSPSHLTKRPADQDSQNSATIQKEQARATPQTVYSSPTSPTTTQPEQSTPSSEIDRDNKHHHNTPPFKIIVLAMDRFSSLQRLLTSLQQADYRNDTVDLEIRFDQPPEVTPEWQQQVQHWQSWYNSLDWPHGATVISTASYHQGLRRAWLAAWRPTRGTREERAIILEDDITVSPFWYTWIQGAYMAYGHRHDIAGFSLQRQQTVAHVKLFKTHKVPNNNGLPFLYRLVGSIGFAPLADRWLDFLEFADCALETKLSLNLTSLITTKWYYKLVDPRSMWTQLFIYFCNYYDLYTLYVSPTDARTLAAHWREKGAHAKKTLGPDFPTVEHSDAVSTWNMSFPSDVVQLDWDARPVSASDSTRPRTLVLCAAAVGYPASEFDRFLSSLRQHYAHDVAMLVWEGEASDIFALLKHHGVHVVTTSEAGGPRSSKEWNKVNRARWQFYQDVCTPERYDLCLTIDFRDSLFQDDPFRHMRAGEDDHGKPDVVMHVYEHNMTMNNWHIQRAEKCRHRSDGISGQPILNAGGFIGSPGIFPQIAWWQAQPRPCDDQLALNLGVYSGLFNASIIRHSQGEGSINNVGWGGAILRDGRGRYLNQNCFPSPVVDTSTPK